MTDNPYELTNGERKLIEHVRRLAESSTSTVPPMMTIRIVEPGIIQIWDSVPRGTVDKSK